MLSDDKIKALKQPQGVDGFYKYTTPAAVRVQVSITQNYTCSKPQKKVLMLKISAMFGKESAIQPRTFVTPELLSNLHAYTET